MSRVCLTVFLGRVSIAQLLASMNMVFAFVVGRVK